MDFIFGILCTIIGIVAVFLFRKKIVSLEKEPEGKQGWQREHSERLLFGAKAGKWGSMAIAIIGVVMIVSSFIVVVPAGHVGVVVLFGNVDTDNVLHEGMSLVNPFVTVHNMSIRTQETKEIMDHSAPTKEGLMLQMLEVSILYHLEPENAASVYQNVGEDYADILLLPNFRSAVRKVTGAHKTEALYSSAREQLAQEITVATQVELAGRGIYVESTPLRALMLPEKLATAIENKMKAEQEAQQMEFVLQKERQEAERKRVEASGIADFQRIVTRGISEPLLRWKGIEATEKLAESPNTKIVVVGGKDGLPLILNSQ